MTRLFSYRRKTLNHIDRVSNTFWSDSRHIFNYVDPVGVKYVCYFCIACYNFLFPFLLKQSWVKYRGRIYKFMQTRFFTIFQHISWNFYFEWWTRKLPLSQTFQEFCLNYLRSLVLSWLAVVWQLIHWLSGENNLVPLHF